MEGDLFQATPMPEPLNFNPLPPHGGRPSQRLLHFAHNSFQSTPSAWRETICVCWCFRRIVHFNPLPPHGGRRIFRLADLNVEIFQSTPSAWRETRHSLKLDREEAFQSTPSAWRETCAPAPVAGSQTRQSMQLKLRETCAPAPVAGAAKYFNPLPPHGGRHITLTLRQPIPIISIHSLRMEGDLKKKCLPRSVLDFNPLPPHGGRHFEDNESAEAFLFQSTPSAWRGTFDT